MDILCLALLIEAAYLGVTLHNFYNAGPVVVLGGGPAGLTSAYELTRRSAEHKPIVFEALDRLGGISRTESYKGNRFDIGGHRFFTKVGEVEEMWQEVLETDFITVPRLSRIYYRNKFYDYPLKVGNALSNLGPVEGLRIIASYFRWQVFPSRKEESFEEWVTNRFGARLYGHFFESYTQKVWGISPKEIRADWAAQRIKNLSLWKVLYNALTGSNDTASLIEKFKYPRLGPGMMWEAVGDRVTERGGEVHLNHRVTKIHRVGQKVTAVDVESTDDDGTVKSQTIRGDQFVNTLDLKTALNIFDPLPPEHVLAAAAKLKYRDFLIVTLILDDSDPFPDNWIYVHAPDVRVGRIQNFRAWSPEMVANQALSSIGMEYFCNTTDALWSTADEELVKMAAGELEKIGLSSADKVTDGAVIRQPKAYPVYDTEYAEALDVIKPWIQSLENFQTVGRNGLHRYNNQDHSMLSGMLAARNILGEENDVWSVNVERSYHEEMELKRRADVARGTADTKDGQLAPATA